MPDALSSSSQVPLRTLQTAHAEHAESSRDAAGGSTAVALPPGSSAISQLALKKIEDDIQSIHDQIQSAGEQASAAAVQDTDQADAVVAAQLTRLQQLRTDGAAPLEVLKQQFLLEGLAIRAVLTKDDDIKDLASGKLTAKAVGDRLNDGLCSVLTRSNLYNAISSAASTAVTGPFSVEELGDKGFGANRQERESFQKLLTHDAYKNVLAALPADDPQREPIKLAHEAFKIDLALTENQLEVDHMNAEARYKLAGNKIPFVRSEDSRANAQADLRPAMDAARTALDEHAKASNHILRDEHQADHRNRALNKDSTTASWIRKIGEQVIVAGGPQGGASKEHWGDARNYAITLADYLLQDKEGFGPMLGRTAIQALALGTAHKLVSDGPREILHSAAEFGGWAHPAVASNAEQLFPDPAPIRLRADGEIEPVPDAELTAARNQAQRERKQFKDESARFKFGNVHADNRGEAAFGTANLVRDVAVSVGYEGADTEQGRAMSSLVGGVGMSSSHGVGDLMHEVLGHPTHVIAKRHDPCNVIERVATGLQKLDLTKEENRLDLFSKGSSAFVGIFLSEAIDATWSAQTHDRQVATDKKSEEVGMAILHALGEFSKPYATLAPFFSGLSVAKEAKALPGTASDATKRILVGWENIRHPARPAATSAYPAGTFGYKRQVANTAFKGVAQVVAQTGAVGVEKAPELIGKGLGAAGRGIAWAGSGMVNAGRQLAGSGGQDGAGQPPSASQAEQGQAGTQSAAQQG